MHYYTREGESCYEIRGKNGKMRTPYTKEAKALGLAPGVTSINGQLANSGISNWVITTIINICKENPYCAMGTSAETWATKIRQLYKQESERITTQGHKYHDALEVYYKSGTVKPQYKEYIVPVIELIAETWPQLARTDWIAERAFNYKGLYGGKVDLSTEYGDGIILDFKTKDTEDLKKFQVYDSHMQQLVAYRYGLELPSAKTGNILFSALKPNIVTLTMHEEEELLRNWAKFKVLLQHWHLVNFETYVEYNLI